MEVYSSEEFNDTKQDSLLQKARQHKNALLHVVEQAKYNTNFKKGQNALKMAQLYSWSHFPLDQKRISAVVQPRFFLRIILFVP